MYRNNYKNAIIVNYCHGFIILYPYNELSKLVLLRHTSPELMTAMDGQLCSFPTKIRTCYMTTRAMWRILSRLRVDGS